MTYHVSDLDWVVWPNPAYRHDLPRGGLVVVRDPRESRIPRVGWLGLSAPSWRRLARGTSPVTTDLPEEWRPATPGPAVSLPPQELLRHIAWLGRTAHSTAVFYYHQMADGRTEGEYAWVFGARDTLIFREAQGRMWIQFLDGYRLSALGTVLQHVMTDFDIALPTPYFALHTRECPWDLFRLER